MSLIDEILEIVTSGYYGSYRKMRGFSSGRPKKYPSIKKSSEAAVASTISKLKNQGFIEKRKNKLFITKKGHRRLKTNQKWDPRSERYPIKTMKESIIISFDVPEELKSQREWLRSQLYYFDFKQLQKSVWIGNTELPDAFIKDLGERNILNCIHIFEVRRRGTL